MSFSLSLSVSEASSELLPPVADSEFKLMSSLYDEHLISYKGINRKKYEIRTVRFLRGHCDLQKLVTELLWMPWTALEPFETRPSLALAPLDEVQNLHDGDLDWHHGHLRDEI